MCAVEQLKKILRAQGHDDSCDDKSELVALVMSLA